MSVWGGGWGGSDHLASIRESDEQWLGCALGQYYSTTGFNCLEGRDLFCGHCWPLSVAECLHLGTLGLAGFIFLSQPSFWAVIAVQGANGNLMDIEN